MGRRLGIGLGVLVVWAALTAAAQSQEPIKIGFFGPLTGPVAADGVSARHAVELALTEVNAAGGILGRPVQLVVYDDRLNTQEAVAIAHKLIEKDQVVGVVSGAFSGPSRVAAPLFARARIPMVAGYAVHPDVTRGSDSNFRIGFLGVVDGGAAGEYAVTVLKSRRPAMLSIDNDFGREIAAGFAARVEARGVQVLVQQFYAYPGEKDFRPLLTRIKAAGPDLLFAASYHDVAALMTLQARDLGFTTPILAKGGFDSPKFIELARGTAEGVIVATNLDRDDPRPAVQARLKSYEAAYHTPLDMVGASSFDAAMVLLNAITRAGTTARHEVIRALNATADYQGLTGTIRRFVRGEVVKPVQFQIVKDGRFRRHGVVDAPEVITPPVH
ncbi:MAG: ABC transporter substrate-binding protein [Candidatus Methylomirabilales bacterium]